MSLVGEQWAFLQDVALLILKAKDTGYVLTAGEVYRTLEQQQIYMRTGRSKTMNSMHLKRLAVDLNIFRGGRLVTSPAAIRPLADFWESLSPKNKWGGNWKTFKDLPHFERHVD